MQRFKGLWMIDFEQKLCHGYVQLELQVPKVGLLQELIYYRCNQIKPCFLFHLNIS